MAEYQPFLISNFKTGKSIGLEPWLSPEDAFETLENMFVNKGVLEKRLGYAPFATMTHGAVPQTATTITGIHTYLNGGMPTLLVMDGLRVNKYNAVDGVMSDIAGSDIFNGASGDFFSFLNARKIGYMVNNVDQIFQWNGTGNVSAFNVPIDTDETDNQLDTCRHIFLKDDRILLLDTTEKGSWKPNRCRFSRVPTDPEASFVGTDFNASGSGFVDAETQERIAAAGFIARTNNIAIFFQGPDGGSLWQIKKTNVTGTPLKWERFSDTEGCRAPYSGVTFKDGIGVIGLSNFLFFDGFTVRNIELPNLRDILEEFNDANIRSVFGYNQKEGNQRHVLFTSTNSGDSNSNRILDYNIDENNFTIHKSEQSFFLNTIGGFNGQKVPTLIELDDVITFDGDIVANMTVDSRAILGTPSPFTLIGGRNSQVYKWNSGAFDGTADDNGKIAIQALSSRLNPFVKQGRKAALEKIEFYVDNDATASFTAGLFKNTSSTAYKSKVVSANLSNDKAFVTIFADGEVGNFHRLKISHTERSNRPRIHAMIWYMKPAGRIAQ